MNITLKQKFAAIEADLIAASAHGDTALHSAVFKKFAALIEDEDDIEAVVNGILDLTQPTKAAAGFGIPSAAPAMGGGQMAAGMGNMLAQAATLAGPVYAIAKFIGNIGNKDRALKAVQAAAPMLFAQNPQRAQMVFETVFSVAPTLAQNPALMADLMKQMMAMPALDIGTVARLAEIAKNTSGARGANPTQEALGAAGQIASGFGPQKRAKAIHKTAAGVRTFFNWSTDVVKEAGLTDAFTGSGTTMEQANNATNMNQMEQGNTMLPLDNIVHELLMKEMELQQREQMLVQQEQQLQQALAAVQQMGSAYQSQTGVDPNSGDPAAAPEPEKEEEAPAPAPAAEEAPAEEAAPAPMPQEGGAAPFEGEQPAADGEQQMMEENPQSGVEEAAAGADETVPPAEDGAPAAAGNDGMIPYEEPAADPMAALPPPVDQSPEAQAAAAEGLMDAGQPMPPAQDVQAEELPVDDSQFPPAGAEMAPQQNDGYMEASAPQAPMIDNANPGPSGPQGESEEAPTDEGGAPAAEGAIADNDGEDNKSTDAEDGAESKAPAAEGDEGGEGEEAPAGDADGFDGEPSKDTAPEPVVEGEEGGEAEGEEALDGGEGEEAEGEEKPEGEHDMELMNALESEGPNTAESVEGTPEDAAHDALNKAPEGTPEDEVADKELAATLNAGGQMAGQPDVPPAMPTPAAAPAPAAPAMGGAPSANGGHEIVLPLRITVKIGEDLNAARNEAETNIRDIIASLKDK